MSRSTPTPNAPNPQPTVRDTLHYALRRPPEPRSRWALLSMILHGAGIVILAFFTYTQLSRDQRRAAKPKSKLTPEKVKKLSENLLEANREKLKGNVLELVKIKRKIEEITDKRNRDYQLFCSGQTGRMPAETRERLDELRTRAAEAERCIKKISTAGTKVTAAKSRGDSAQIDLARNELTTQIGELRQALLQMENAQESSALALGWTAPELVATQQELQKQSENMRGKIEELNKELGKSQEYIAFSGNGQAHHENMIAKRAGLERARDMARKKLEQTQKQEAAAKTPQQRQSAQKLVELYRKLLAQAEQRLVALKPEERQTHELIARLKIAESALVGAATNTKLFCGELQELLDRQNKLNKTYDARFPRPATNADGLPTLSAIPALEAAGNKAAVPLDELAGVKPASAASSAKIVVDEKTTPGKPDEPASANSYGSAQKFPDPPAVAQVQELDLAGLYRCATELEGLTIKEYCDIRAVDLSMLREMALDHARRNIDSPQTERAQLDDALLTGAPQNSADLAKQKEAVRTALAEGDRMQSYCQSLLDSLLAQSAEDTTDDFYELSEEEMRDEFYTLEELVELLRQEIVECQGGLQGMQELAEKADADAKKARLDIKPENLLGPRVAEAQKLLAEALESLNSVDSPSDLATAVEALMKAAMLLKKAAGAAEDMEKAAKGKGNAQAAGSAGAAAKGFAALINGLEGAGKFGNALSRARQVDRRDLLSGRGRLRKARAMARAASGADAQVADISELMRMSPEKLLKKDTWTAKLVKTKIPFPVINPADKGIVWGREIADNGPVASKWMAVDNWYVIGPWENPDRVNRDRKFPPENSVNLDATYTGKNGKLLRWTFMQANSVQHRAVIQPLDAQPYAIYYLYTEIQSDRERDIWMVTGSDDKSKIWINDMLVWESAPQLKPWRINEGYRKIHLRKGVNRILYRLENGWKAVAMSLLFHTGPGKF